MENEREDSAFVIYSFVLCDAVGKCVLNLYMVSFCALACIMGNAKCKFENFPFQKPFAAPNRLIDGKQTGAFREIYALSNTFGRRPHDG
ncbi:MAG: hypothetical protein ACLSF2_03900 [Butyricicoccus sp.]